MASVTPRRYATGRVAYRVQFRIDGKMSQESYDDYAAAVAFAKLVDTVGGKAAREIALQRDGKSDDMPTLEQWTERYLDADSGLLTGIEPGTRRSYKVMAQKSFLRTLGPLPVDTITKADVGRWVTWQEAQPSGRNKGQLIAPKTVRNYHALLSSTLAAAVQEKLRADNPAFKTRLSKGRRHEGVFLSEEEFATLLHFIPERYKRLVLFLAGTGCRWGEATAVVWGDINLSSTPETIRIDKAWKKSETGSPVLKHPKSSRSRRTISLWPEIIEALGEPQAGDELVFAGAQSGRHLWYGPFRSRVWLPAVAKANDKTACAEAGLRPIGKTPTIHDCRHTHASWLIAAGAPLPYVQARLGHEDITTTVNVYGHLLPDAHRQMSTMMAETMSGVLPRIEMPAISS